MDGVESVGRVEDREKEEIEEASAEVCSGDDKCGWCAWCSSDGLVRVEAETERLRVEMKEVEAR